MPPALACVVGSCRGDAQTSPSWQWTQTEHTPRGPNRNLSGLDSRPAGGRQGGGRTHAMDWWKSDRSFCVAWRNRMVAAWALSDPSQDVLPA